MKYDKGDMNRLWGIIKDKQNIFAGDYIGLAEVNFDLPLDEFTDRNQVKHTVKRDIETMVFTDIKKAIKELSDKDITFHHLSCAAETGFKDNTALCIHYKDKEDHYALAILGINYIPTKETLTMYKKIIQ